MILHLSDKKNTSMYVAFAFDFAQCVKAWSSFYLIWIIINVFPVGGIARIFQMGRKFGRRIIE